MTRYRLTYPAHLYCSVWAESLQEARDQLVGCLKEIHDGMEVALDEDFGDEVLYPDSNSAGEIDPELVLVEDVEEAEANEERESAETVVVAQRCCCDNCTWQGTTEEANPIRDLWQRVDPGGEVPVGECPKCGALAYLDDDASEPDEDDWLRDKDDDEDELLAIDYSCPACRHEWQEQWTCACDSTCPKCGERDITARDYRGAHSTDEEEPA
jgi:hypothetical protein